jgi:hypothetical protein
MYVNGYMKSPVLRDLVEDEVTLNPSFLNNRLIFGNGDKRRGYAVAEHETPFKEIKVAPYEESFMMSNFVGNSRRSVDCGAYLETLEEVVSSSWNPLKFNLVYHSSGLSVILLRI